MREIGPGVTMTINTVARRDPRRRPGGRRRQAAELAARHLRPPKANDGAALRGGDRTALQDHVDKLLGVRARNGAQTNRLEAATRASTRSAGALTNQLSNTEDADIAKTLIQFNSQSAAYQAALRAGANIVQSSLMDFLR